MHNHCVQLKEQMFIVAPPFAQCCGLKLLPCRLLAATALPQPLLSSLSSLLLALWMGEQWCI